METISNSHKIPHTHHLQETKTRKETSPDTTQLTSTNIDILTLTTSPPMKIGFKQSPTPNPYRHGLETTYEHCTSM